MSEQVLRDRNGNRLGSIVTNSDGTQTARDRNGNKLGVYEIKNNITRDLNGNRIGEGNFLSSLITGACK